MTQIQEIINEQCPAPLNNVNRRAKDDMIIVNLTVWESVDALREYVYKSAHFGVLRDRKRWFEESDGPYYALWWIPIGYYPTPEKGKERLDYLREHRETPYALSFKRVFPKPAE